MRYRWEFDTKDIDHVRAFVAKWSGNPLVVERRRRNLSEAKSPIRREQFWMKMVACLLTSQQRSGPDSPVSRFLSVAPFPLSVQRCEEQSDLAGYAVRVLKKRRGIRFTTRIPTFLRRNLPLLTGTTWKECRAALERLRQNPGIQHERAAANFIEDRFAGLGPKQSRNLLQMLGLTRYEIPVDSRVVEWLKKLGFPVPLSTAPLSDRSYYEFVEDGIHLLCRACDVFPCILDAAIFASFDGDKWTAELARR